MMTIQEEAASAAASVKASVQPIPEGYRMAPKHDLDVKSSSWSKIPAGSIARPQDPEEIVFRQIFDDLMTHGNEVAPRGLKILELEDYSYELPPRARFCSFEDRKINLPYMKKEFLWYLRGDRTDLSIGRHAAMWRGLIDWGSGADAPAGMNNFDWATGNLNLFSGVIHSNYGQYVFSSPPKSDTPYRYQKPGFDKVVAELRHDKDSRRASIPIMSNAHQLTAKDVPCTYALNFRIRNDELKLSVSMRSQDAFFGMGNDAPCFSFIQEMVWAALVPSYPGLRLGSYHHSANSFHIYEKHFEQGRAIAEWRSKFVKINCPEIKPEELKFLMGRTVHQIYPDGVEWLTKQGALSNAQPEQPDPDIRKALRFFVDQNADLKFTSWLTTH